MFIKDGKRFEICNAHTIDDVQYPMQFFAREDNRLSVGVIEIPDPVRGNDEIEYTHEIDEAPYNIITPKSQEQLDQQRKSKALAELTALEQANLMPRVTREFLIAATLMQAASLGLTEVQLIDPLDPAYSPGFKKMWDFNEQTKVLRAKL